jgi:hypothetical protein
VAEPKVRQEGRAIIVFAGLSPEGFHPEWFAARDLIAEEDAKKAKIEVVSPDYSSFQLPWADFKVTTERVEAFTSEPTSYETLRDLVASTFRLMDGTVIRGLSIVQHYHFAMSQPGSLLPLVSGSLETLRELGFGEKPYPETLEFRSARTDGGEGFLVLLLQPSHQVSDGVYAAVNDYYDLSNLGRDDAFETLQERLSASWDTSLAATARPAIDALLSKHQD